MSRPSLLHEVLRLHPEASERQARGWIMRGDVLVGTTVVTKPGAAVRNGDVVSLKAERRFVSRAGTKLDGVLDRLGVLVRGKVLIDAGSSTGGFTDCLLQRGAELVYCVDVGRNQLAWELRMDPRVRVMEGTNVMALEAASLPTRPHGAVCDLSFRSIRSAASRLVALTSEEWLVALVKPQFEWRDPCREFRGVVRSGDDVLGILHRLIEDLGREGVCVRAVRPSGLPGRRGNREFFFLIGPLGFEPIRLPEALDAAVREGLAR